MNGLATIAQYLSLIATGDSAFGISRLP